MPLCLRRHKLLCLLRGAIHLRAKARGSLACNSIGIATEFRFRQYVGEIAEDSDKTELYGPAVRLMYEWLADIADLEILR